MVEKLVSYLKSCDDAYYNSENVVVNNDTYDALVETLRRLAPDHPYLQKVGAALRKDAKGLGRLVPMGTLSKYHKEDSVKEWLSKESGMILMAPKYDGFGIELVYRDGLLVMASTRGDGYVGEDVLEAVLRIQSVPVRLPDEFKSLTRVRGEAIIPRKHHDKVKELGYSAMRNAVPGIVRSNRKDALEYVDFIAYEFFDEYTLRSLQRDRYEKVFNVEDWQPYPTDDFGNILLNRNSFGEHKEDYLYEIDGIVLKTDMIQEDDLSCPNHQIAWKFKSNRETTTLRDIEFNVGATGAISVVGIFDEVEFQGAKLKRASFGSLPLYAEMRPAIGDIIEVSRRGDIIPWIEEVVIRNSDDYIELTHCPCCGSPIEADKCVNTECPDRVKLKLYQYIKAVGIKGIGYSLVESLVDAKLITKLPDIYEIDAENLLSIPRQGRSSVEKWESLQKKELSILEFLCAYPFENAGKSLWKSILDKFSLKEIIELDKEKLMNANIKGIGSSKIDSIVSQLKENREEISQMIQILSLE